MTDIGDKEYYREQQEIYSGSEWNTRKLRDQLEVMDRRNHELYIKLREAETERNHFEAAFKSYKRDWIDFHHALSLLALQTGTKNNKERFTVELTDREMYGVVKVYKNYDGKVVIELTPDTKDLKEEEKN